MLLLDTTVLIDVLRGRPAGERVRDLHREGQAPWICAVNVEEVLRGAAARDEAATVRFLEGLHLAPLGRREGERAGRWRRDYARRGITLGQGNCLIAAAAVGIDARLATGNPEHFPMPELAVEHWPVGE
ncbi:MAG TPA: PIN domain-containing protein [Solirubrobacteraceae bacterium]|nr:PIN domain-containing protein [Solirubrobacteraceae bacterium]